MRIRTLVVALLIGVSVGIGFTAAEPLFVPHLFAEGFLFPEGPDFDDHGNLYLVDYRDTRIYRVSPEGRVSVVTDTGHLNNSALFDGDGNLYITSHGARCVFRLEEAEELTVATASCGGDSLLGPNDLTWGPGARLYFTDPHGSNHERPFGKVCYIDTDGRTKQFTGGLAYPNGIVYHPPSRRLFVTEPWRNHIMWYEIEADGSCGESGQFCHFDNNAHPDGIAFDTDDNLWVADWTHGEVLCVSLEGDILHRIDLPEEHATNLAFGGPGNATLYVTALSGSFVGRVYRIETPVAGAEVYRP